MYADAAGPMLYDVIRLSLFVERLSIPPSSFKSDKVLCRSPPPPGQFPTSSPSRSQSPSFSFYSQSRAEGLFPSLRDAYGGRGDFTLGPLPRHGGQPRKAPSSFPLLYWSGLSWPFPVTPSLFSRPARVETSRLLSIDLSPFSLTLCAHRSPPSLRIFL